jgi:tRNA(Ile)-lysidine synthase
MELAPSAEAIARFRSDLARLVGDEGPRLGLAVSGGSDSLALLVLGEAAFPGAVMAATIDHGLRPEAAEEAEFVASLCRRLNVPHEILRPPEPIAGNLQSSARRARYALLEQWRGDHGLDWILTAHHLDDQAETLLMRLNRGSGVGGLAAIRAVNGSVVRPLLGWRRAELEAIVARAGIAPIQDPSNEEERFDRVRMRRWLQTAEGIDPQGLARSASALAEAEAALDWATERLWAERANESQDGLRLDINSIPAELRRRLVRRAIEKLSPGAEPRGDEIGRFIASLESSAMATLAGVKGKGGETWFFTLAPPRRN